MKTQRVKKQGCNDMEQFYITGRKHFQEYRKRHEGERDYFNNEKRYGKIATAYGQILGEFLAEYEGGVLIKDFLYSFMFMIPKRQSFRLTKAGKRGFNSEKGNNYIYSMTAVFSGKGRTFWDLQTGTSKQYVRDEIRTNLKKGLKYKSFFNTLKEVKLFKTTKA